MIIIRSNGSKWAGQEPDTIEDLLQVLDEYPLDRTFEAYGNFIQVLTPENLPRKPEWWGMTDFWGNFQTISHVFNIITDEPELIDTLTDSIRANQQRPDYQSQPIPEKRTI